MFALTLTRAERAEIMDRHRIMGVVWASLYNRLIHYTGCPREYADADRWYNGEVDVTFTVHPTFAVYFLPYLTGEELKQYSPNLANKLAGLREWILSLGPAE